MADARPPSSPPSLEYETEFREERLPDGTLRMTVVTERARAMATAAALAGMGLAGSALLAAAWWMTGSVRAGVFALFMGPMGVMIAGGVALVQATSPRRHVHTVDVGDNGLTIRTTIAGDPVTRRHARAEVIGVVSNDMALEVRTTKDEYSCVAFAKREHLVLLADRIRAELGLSPHGPRA